VDNSETKTKQAQKKRSKKSRNKRRHFRLSSPSKNVNCKKLSTSVELKSPTAEEPKPTKETKEIKEISVSKVEKEADQKESEAKEAKEAKEECKECIEKDTAPVVVTTLIPRNRIKPPLPTSAPIPIPQLRSARGFGRGEKMRSPTSGGIFPNWKV
jgi:hypothetical protein